MLIRTPSNILGRLYLPVFLFMVQMTGLEQNEKPSYLQLLDLVSHCY